MFDAQAQSLSMKQRQKKINEKKMFEPNNSIESNFYVFEISFWKFRICSKMHRLSDRMVKNVMI